MRDENTDYGACAGCAQWLDPVLSHHVFDEGPRGHLIDPPARYHMDCCPGKHVTGNCGQEVIEE
jgi:hypothetical protein